MASFTLSLALIVLSCFTSSAVQGCETGATYSLVTDCVWSARRFPVDYPSNAHWSPLCGTTHNDQFSMYKLGEPFMDNGMKDLAELGSCTKLGESISTCVDNKYCGTQLLRFPCSVFGGTCSFTGSVDVTCNYRYISMASMAAPSPDWFIGFSANLWDAEKGEWRPQYSRELYAKDGGTDSGTTFKAPNDPTTPWEAVRLFDAMDASNIWWNPDEQKLYKPCTVTLTRQ